MGTITIFKSKKRFLGKAIICGLLTVAMIFQGSPAFADMNLGMGGNNGNQRPGVPVGNNGNNGGGNAIQGPNNGGGGNGNGGANNPNNPPQGPLGNPGGGNGNNGGANGNALDPNGNNPNEQERRQKVERQLRKVQDTIDQLEDVVDLIDEMIDRLENAAAGQNDTFKDKLDDFRQAVINGYAAIEQNRALTAAERATKAWYLAQIDWLLQQGSNLKAALNNLRDHIAGNAGDPNANPPVVPVQGFLDKLRDYKVQLEAGNPLSDAEYDDVKRMANIGTLVGKNVDFNNLMNRYNQQINNLNRYRKILKYTWDNKIPRSQKITGKNYFPRGRNNPDGQIGGFRPSTQIKTLAAWLALIKANLETNNTAIIAVQGDILTHATHLVEQNGDFHRDFSRITKRGSRAYWTMKSLGKGLVGYVRIQNDPVLKAQYDRVKAVLDEIDEQIRLSQGRPLRLWVLGWQRTMAAGMMGQIMGGHRLNFFQLGQLTVLEQMLSRQRQCIDGALPAWQCWG